MYKIMKKVVILKTLLLILQVNLEASVVHGKRIRGKYYTTLTIVPPNAISKLSTSQLIDSKAVFSKITYQTAPSKIMSQFIRPTTAPPKTISRSSITQLMKSTIVPQKNTSESSTLKSTESKTIPPKTISNSTSKSTDSGIIPPNITSQIEQLRPAPPQNTSQLLKSISLNSTAVPPKITPPSTSKSSDSKTESPKITSHSSISKSEDSTNVSTKITTLSSTAQFMNSTTVPSNVTSHLSTSKSLNSTNVPPKTAPLSSTSKIKDSNTEPPKNATNSAPSKSSNSTILPDNITSNSSTSNFKDPSTVPPETSQLEKSTPADPKTTSTLSASQFQNSTTVSPKTMDSKTDPPKITSNLPTSNSSNSTTVPPKTAFNISTSVNSTTEPPETASHLSTSQLSKTISNSSESQSTNSTTLPLEKYQSSNNTTGPSPHKIPAPNSTSIPSSTTLQEPAIEELTGFKNLVSSSYYVDKTLLLKSLVHTDSKNGECTLITMPTGFGKTTNLEMVKRFYEIEVNEQTGLPISKDLSNVQDTPNYALFTKEYDYGRLKISHSGDFMEKYFGKYPVIHLDFAKSQANFEPSIGGAIEWMQNTISEAFIRHEYLLNSTELEIEQKTIIQQWCGDKSHKLISTNDVVTGLLNLLNYLYIHYSKEVIVLVDEYDLLARWAIENVADGYELRKILDFYICIYSNALRDQSELEFALFAGLIHIDYSGFRVALPDLKTYRLGRSNEFVKFYGFTAEEVDLQFKKFETDIDRDVVTKAIKYYDGYSTIGEDKIYAPVSITRFLHNKKILNYWSEGIKITNNWPALRFFNIRMIMLSLLLDDGPTKIRNMHKLNFEDISTLQNCLDAKKKPGLFSKTISIFYNYILDLGYLGITSQNENYIEVAVPNSETSEALNLFLDTYYNKTATSEEFQIQTDFVNALKSISLADHHIKLQQITTNLSQLVETVSSQIGNFHENDFKQILREVFIRHNLQSYEEDRIRIRTKEDKEKNGQADFFLTNLQNIYIVIETEFQSTSWNGLLKIKNKYLPKILASVKNNSAVKKSYLLLGMNLQQNGTVTISANHTYTPNNFTIEKNYTGYTPQFLTFEKTALKQ